MSTDTNEDTQLDQWQDCRTFWVPNEKHFAPGQPRNPLCSAHVLTMFQNIMGPGRVKTVQQINEDLSPLLGGDPAVLAHDGPCSDCAEGKAVALPIMQP